MPPPPLKNANFSFLFVVSPSLKKSGFQKGDFGRNGPLYRNFLQKALPLQCYPGRRKAMISDIPGPQTRNEAHSPNPPFYKTALLLPLEHCLSHTHSHWNLSGMFRRSASLAIPHLKSFAAIPSVSLVHLGHTNRSVFLSHESQCEIDLV